MQRSFWSVVQGLVAIIVLNGLLFAVAKSALDGDQIFVSGTHEVTILWFLVMAGVHLFSGLIGGLVTTTTSPRGSKAPLVLAAFFATYGAYMAMNVTRAGGAEAFADTSNNVSVTYAMASLWVMWPKPIAIVLGILMSYKLFGRAKPAADSPVVDSKNESDDVVQPA